jgi:hypothetical protein
MKEDRIFNEILDSIKNLRSIVKRRKWELIQDLIVGKPAIQKELNRVEKSIGKSIPEDFRKLLKYSKHLEFCYQYDEKMPTKFRENFSGEINWDLDKIVSLTKLYEEWLDASLDPEYNDEHAIAITEKVGKNRFPFMSISNGDFIVMGDSPSEIIYLSHEGGEVHGKKLGENLWDFFEFHSKVGFAGPEDWQFQPFYDFKENKMIMQGEIIDRFSEWLNKKG